MEKKYLRILAKEYPTIESAASEIINLSAIRSLPKGTEYFFSDLHGEYQSFLHMLKSASGMIRNKIDVTLSKTVSVTDREQLAALIYNPESELKKLADAGVLDDEWKKLTIYRLVLLCETVSAKYTRSKVRKCVPKDLQYILDELLNVTDDINKDFYYEVIINTILDTGIAESFIISMCILIRSLAIDKLHIIGDIFDRGPRADIIMDELLAMRDVDIQWGNHDISWMGAASQNRALMANVIRISMRYNCFDLLEDGYGFNLRSLATFASDVYKDDDCALFFPNILDHNIYDPVDAKLVSKMHKAITIIQLKLEGQLIKAHPEWEMNERNIFERVDFEKFTVTENGKEYALLDRNFPTVDKNDPLKLSEKEEELMRVIGNSFRHSEKLHNHIRFLFSHGSMYKICNGNLLFHGCIPMDENGEFAKVTINGKEYAGKALLDEIDRLVNSAYFRSDSFARDFMWYLWCGPKSPLYGKDKMSFFERLFIDDKALHEEHFNSYYSFSEKTEICEMIIEHFGLDKRKGHIINGHVPVKIKDGESPIKADGKLFVIDGGISKAYQKTTGIAGYTLIYDSHSLRIAEHRPFVQGESEHTPTVRVVELMEERVRIADTDKGKEITDRIQDLRELLKAYRNGYIKET